MARVTLTCGQIQQGKTTLAFYMAVRENPWTIVLDPSGTKIFDAIPAHLQFSSFDTLAEWLIAHGAESPHWIIVLRSDNPQDYVRLLEAAPKLRHVCLLVDELPGVMGYDGAEYPLTRIAQAGAHMGNRAGVSLSITAQRAMNVPANIRSQVQCLRSFRQREPRDLQWIAGFASPEFAAQVAELPPHHWVQFPPEHSASKVRPDEGVSLAGDRRSGGGDVGGAPAAGEVQPGEQGATAVQVAGDAGAGATQEPARTT